MNPLLPETHGLDFEDTEHCRRDRLARDLRDARTNPAFAAFVLFAVLNVGIALGALFFTPLW